MDESTKAYFKSLEESHLDIDVRKSKEKMAHILADEFKEIGSSGKMYTKSDCLNEGVGLFEMTVHDFEVYPLSEDLTLTTYLLINATRNRNTLRSSIWKYIDNRWQLYFHQGTITEIKE